MKRLVGPRVLLRALTLLVLVEAMMLIASIAMAQGSPGPPSGPPGAPNSPRLIVKLTPAAASAAMNAGDLLAPGIASAMERAHASNPRPLFRHLWRGKSPARAADRASAARARFSTRAVRAPATASVPDLENIFVVDLPTGTSAAAAIESLQREPGVVWVEPDRRVSVSRTPNDPYFKSSGSWGQPYLDMWGLHRISMPDAWRYAIGVNTLVIAVVDTGLDASHPDMSQRVWANQDEIPGNGIDDDYNGYVDDAYGWDFAYGDNDPRDGHGHGTHVSGTIAAATNNHAGIAGICWRGRVMAVKGLGDDGYGWDSDLAQAMVYAADNGADVLNNSWGGYGYSQVVQDAVDYCNSVGCIVVAAAGNDMSDTKDFFPSGLKGVVSVGATDPDDVRAWFSNWGESLDVCAPGLDILSLRATGTAIGTPLNDYYTCLDGTSMACPHAVGVLALLIAEHPMWPASRIIGQLVGTCDNVDALNPEYAGLLGFGRVNAAQALGGTATADPRFALMRWRASEVLGDGGPGFEPGERVAVTAIAKFYLGTAADVSMTVSTTDGAVDWVNDGSVDIGIVQGWGAIDNESTPSVFDISEDCPRMHRIPLDLTLTAGTAEQHCLMEVPANMYPPGWPVDKGPWSFRTPIVADVDKDGKPEVVISSDVIHVLKGNGLDAPGWPTQALPSGYCSAGMPTVGDLDGDGGLEVVAAIRDWGMTRPPAIGAWKKDGSSLSGFPIYLQWDSAHETWPLSVTLANLDGKPGLDVIVIANDGINWPAMGHIQVYRKNGTPRAGWPPAPWSLSVSPDNTRVAVGDINGDRTPELVMAEEPVYSWAAPRLWAWRADGSVAPGFPMTLYSGYWVRGGPALADIDEDGVLDIVVGSGETVWVIRGNGSVFPGWPQTGEDAVVADLDRDGHLEVITQWVREVRAYRRNGSLMWRGSFEDWGSCEPVVGDIDGDSDLEVVLRNGFDQIFAWHHDGMPVAEFPLIVGPFGALHYYQVWCGIAITDVDADGYADLVTGSSAYDSSAYAFWTNGRYNAANVEWAMQGGNPTNDGVYKLPSKRKRR